MRNLGVDNLLVTWIKTCKKQDTCLFSKTTPHNTFKTTFKKWKPFQKTYIFVYIPHMDHYKGCHHIGFFSKHFQTHTHEHHFKQLKPKGKWSKQVTKSPWITMDRKGANTFPFYNLLPEPKKTSHRFLLWFLTFP